MLVPLRWRLVILGAAMFGLIAVVGVLAHQAWMQLAHVRAHFESLEGESSTIAGELHAAVEGMHATLLQALLSGHPEAWTQFNEETARVRAWLADRRELLTSAPEKALLTKIAGRLEEYIRTAEKFSVSLVPGGAEAGPPALGDELAGLAARNDELVQLSFDLAEAHNRSLGPLLGRADRAIATIQWIILASLSLLLAFGLAFAWIVYRDSIVPLRRELVESRQRLERSEKLASLGVLSAGVAHEIRNPLTAMKARLFTLRKACAGNGSALDDVGVVGGEIDRLERIVQTFLRLARPPEVVLAPEEPLAILRRVRDLLEPQWSPRGIRIEVEETAADPVRADREQIQQVLINLVQNAAEAMPGGGVVVLRARHDTHVADGKRARAVRIEVVDNGPGMSRETQARLFDPFFTTKAGGTGLGLALSAGIVEKHGGSIGFSSVPGRGTVFRVRLPVAETR